LGVVSYLPSIVTMALSCIICKMKRDIGQNRDFFHTPLHSTPPLGRSPSEYRHLVWYGKTRMVGYPTVKKYENMYNRLHSIPACDRQTDRQTDRDILPRHNPHYAHASSDNNHVMHDTICFIYKWIQIICSITYMMIIQAYKIHNHNEAFV